MDSDVVIVGGGAAGLQAALTLGRMRFRVTVVDAGKPSNAPAHAIGGLLGQPGTAPLDFLAQARDQLAEHENVEIVQGDATRVDPGAVTHAGGTITTRAVILATGCDYTLPEIDGVAERWGDTVVHCPFCHGWEARGRRIGLLSAGPEHEEHLVPLLSLLTDKVQVHRDVTTLDGLDDDIFFAFTPPVPRDAAFAHLGLARTEMGLLEVGDFGHTSVAGIYAAGDLAAQAPSVVQALASGQRAAVGATRDLM